MGIIICFVDDVMWGGSQSFMDVINSLKETFNIRTENHQVFDFIRVHLEQHTDFSISLDQNSYTKSICSYTSN